MLQGFKWLDNLGRPTRSTSINNYGGWLKQNKQRMVQAAQKLGASHEETLTLVAVAMQETTHMDANERDASKDNAGLAANYSCLNMNGDMLGRLGFRPGSGRDLNRNENADEAVRYFLMAVRKFSLNGFLAFHRAGSTGLDQFQKGGQDGYRKNDYMDVQGYIDGFVSLCYQLEKDSGLLWDDRRVDVYVEHR